MVKKNRSVSGMTLIEVMIAAALLGVIAAVIASMFSGFGKQAISDRQNDAKTKAFRRISQAISNAASIRVSYDKAVGLPAPGENACLGMCLGKYDSVVSLTNICNNSGYAASIGSPINANPDSCYSYAATGAPIWYRMTLYSAEDSSVAIAGEEPPNSDKIVRYTLEGIKCTASMPDKSCPIFAVAEFSPVFFIANISPPNPDHYIAQKPTGSTNMVGASSIIVRVRFEKNAASGISSAVLSQKLEAQSEVQCINILGPDDCPGISQVASNTNSSTITTTVTNTITNTTTTTSTTTTTNTVSNTNTNTITNTRTLTNTVTRTATSTTTNTRTLTNTLTNTLSNTLSNTSTDTNAGGGGGGSCFVAGSLVASKWGEIPIEEIKVGMKVWSRSEEGQLELKSVVKTFVHTKNELLELSFEDGTRLTTTAEHPFWSVQQGRYIFAGELDEQRDVLNIEGQPIRLIGKAHLKVKTPVQVFNIEVEGNHNYFIERILVHNKQKSGG